MSDTPGTTRSAIEIVQRQLDWITAKHEAAERMGLRDAARRYWQRIVALDDALTAFAKAGIVR